jgi:hypothetical protein
MSPSRKRGVPQSQETDVGDEKDVIVMKNDEE